MVAAIKKINTSSDQRKYIDHEPKTCLLWARAYFAG